MTRFYTHRTAVPVKTGETLAFFKGRGYYAKPAKVRKPPAVKPDPALPLLFTAWWWTGGAGGQDANGTQGLIDRARTGGFGSIALQWDGDATAADADALRAAGFDVQAWGICGDWVRMGNRISELGPSRFIAQIEGEGQRDALYQVADFGLFDTPKIHGFFLPLDVVTTYSGIEPFTPPNDHPDQLKKRGVKRIWVESYAQAPDNHNPQQMLDTGKRWYGFQDFELLPLVGLYHEVGLEGYDMREYGRQFSVWVAELIQPGQWEKVGRLNR